MRNGLMHCLVFLIPTIVFADGPSDNQAEKVRPVPPPGMEIPVKEAEELGTLRDRFAREIEAAKKQLASRPAQLDLLPDVEIFHKAVDWALRFKEFYEPRELAFAREQLALGHARLVELLSGKEPTWLHQTGLVVRGYRSRIDGSVQPYGLEIGAGCRLPSATPYRLDLWCHGRGEKLTELSFIQQRLKSRGEFHSENHIVLHLYGRYCNANKFAGEMDALEAMDHVQRYYPIDKNRIVMRGFSMGGAAAWQFAVHYPGRWCAAAPGAGFSETTEFLRVFQNEPTQVSPWEQKLLHWYDCPDWSLNLSNLPTVAYSGDKDSQKQAADMMEAAMAKVGLKLTHIIGPNTGHSYHPQSKAEINRRIDSIAAKGREPVPHHLRFVTYSLRYPGMLWLGVDRLVKHWDPGTVDARIVLPNRVEITTTGIAGLTLNFPAGLCPLDPLMEPVIMVDGKKLTAPRVESDRSWKASFSFQNKEWKTGGFPVGELAKKPGLQGPIDDAFMDSFLFVRPTGKPSDPVVHKWVEMEMNHAAAHWRKQFRGLVLIKADTEVTQSDREKHNLILWGDPSSNKIIGELLPKMPIKWDSNMIEIGDWKTESRAKAILGIYPNPGQPNRQIVFNSGFTFREYDYLNNARQIAKLPDWAVVDVTNAATSRWPGRIVRAGFFDEAWKPGESWPGTALKANMAVKSNEIDSKSEAKR
jgi:pimeloyl-ACP methyl ester carboxylesterase